MLNLNKINSSKVKEYFYHINYPTYEENLCKTEMRYFFNKVPKEKYFFSPHYVDPSRSPFIKQCISILYIGTSLENLVTQIKDDKLSYEDFKVSYINYEEENLGYRERRKIEYEIGLNINGEAEMENPKVLLGVTKVDERWILGKYEKNNWEWKLSNRKPYNYSNALDIRTARAIVNIAASNDLKCTIVDPCCGIGTIVIEALSMGLNIKGFEINPMIAENAQKNLKYFGYENVIVKGDMHHIEDNFDVSIVDLPYGLFSPTTLEEQRAIIKTARRISNKMILVTLDDMDEHIISSGFKIVDRCHVSKGTFKRHIVICE